MIWNCGKAYTGVVNATILKECDTMICPKCKRCAEWYIVRTTQMGVAYLPYDYHLECKLCGYQTAKFKSESELNEYFKAHT